MNGYHHQTRESLLKTLGITLTVCTILALTAALALVWRSPDRHVGDSYPDTLPFRPKIIYVGSNITVLNPENAPYIDTQLTLFVGTTRCHASAGTIKPGEKITVSLTDFVDDEGKPFGPILSRAKLLEVRARLNGADVHRDLPPPG